MTVGSARIGCANMLFSARARMSVSRAAGHLFLVADRETRPLVRRLFELVAAKRTTFILRTPRGLVVSLVCSPGACDARHSRVTRGSPEMTSAEPGRRADPSFRGRPEHWNESEGLACGGPPIAFGSDPGHVRVCHFDRPDKEQVRPTLRPDIAYISWLVHAGGIAAT